ncbi:3-oxoacyl-[acyl-carrier-protein] synthase III C-terminal domain-containing protein [Mumia quercus]|uniref:3-oxoacyl-[acyl-carrier-protein] synthase III C-terminal domain-containing protein n=1 Tax=Mumia quercus TaxID=2976125 RepID=UPI0021D010A3|nr:3-oxoacyl-[acyl-carrier-protein] synthase III C-terminal domain-containing protein [Mumia quercus]
MTDPGITGTGWAVPKRIREDDDPVYSALDRTPGPTGVAEADLFTGTGQRRVLSTDEEIESFMVDACQQALDEAGLDATDVDRIYGYASVPAYFTPNSLYEVHARLGMREDSLVVPLNSDFSNFLLGVVHGHEAIVAGGCERVLVVTGSNWTRHVDYRRGHAQAIGDGAGAAVLSPGGALRLVDHQTRTFGWGYSSMTMAVRPRQAHDWAGIPVGEDGHAAPTYLLEPDTGVEVYQTIMRDGLPDLVAELLARHGLSGADVSLITHQGSRALLDHWADRLSPAAYLETLERFGNLTHSTYPVNLALHAGAVQTPYVVIAAVGTGFHVTALLLRVDEALRPRQ